MGRTTVIAVALMLALAAGGAQARALRLIVFPGGFNLPVWLAQERGLFAREGLEVEVVPTPNSVTQMKGLIDGEYDIALTAMDNVVAYRAGLGAVATERDPDVAAVMGLDSGFLTVVGRSDLADLAALRGRKVSVDARSTGYAFVLYEMLARRGVTTEDIAIESAGGALQRWEALRQGRQDATLLITPLDLLAQSEGFRVLARAEEELGAYQGVVAAVRRDWARANREALLGFVRAAAGGLRALADPAEREAARDLLVRNVPGMTSDLARRALDRFLDPRSGFSRTGEIDAAGVATVVALRRKYAAPGTPDLGAVERFVDPEPFRAAVGR